MEFVSSTSPRRFLVSVSGYGAFSTPYQESETRMRPESPDESLWDELVAVSGEDLLSIFLPTHRRGREVSQDPIVLKNELAAAASRLEAMGWKPRDRSERFRHVEGLLDDREFWEHQDLGLAIYVGDDGLFRAVELPVRLSPANHVLGVYLVRPIVAALTDLQAPVLALTRDVVGVFMATARGAKAVEADLPTFGDVNWFVDRETQRQQHPDGAGGKQSRHGHEPSARAGEDLARFLREVDAALDNLGLAEPLIVLGDDNLVARFSDVTGREIVSPDNSGIPTGLSPEIVGELSRPSVVDLERHRSESMMDLAWDRIGVGLGTMDIEEAVAAAFTGRIADLLIDVDADPIWGRIDSRTLEVETHESQRAGDVDLLDRVVVWSRQHGASISIGTGESGSPFMAVFRY